MTPRSDARGHQRPATHRPAHELQAEVTRLRETVRVLVDVAERSSTGIAVLEGDRFTYVNPGFAKTLGYQPHELLTIPAIETVAHSSRLRVGEHVRDSLANKPCPRPLECEGVKKDGSSIFVELSCARTEASDGVSLILMVTDVTERKVAERKIQALNRRLSELAVRDPLTGLYNRRFTEASLERELIAAERSESPVTVVMCDIDHFRALNDALGRRAGDDILQAFGSLLRRRCRRSDLACRYGVEEFLVVFPGMPMEIAVRWAERARAAVTGIRATADSDDMPVTASFGVATFPENGQTWQDLIAAADGARRSAKAAGKNRVECAQPLEELRTTDMALFAARAM